MMVLAGSGSGKTTVITQRINNLIEEHNVNPSNILVVTFTKAAANEMQGRFNRLSGDKNLPVSFGTFHAVFFKILKYAYNYSASNIIRDETRYEYIREIVEKYELEYEDEKEFMSSILSEISVVKGDMIDINTYYSVNCPNDVFRKIFARYEDRLRRANKVDFDDMLVMCYELLSKREDILKAWQNKYKYILVDEFQDINKVQYEVVKLLARPRNNIFIVGDDDQSIYRFRGARPEIMLNFEKDFEGCKRVLLQVNYRSTKNIVDAAANVIKHNKARFDKDIVTEKEEGAKVDVALLKTHIDENKYIINLIRKYIEKGYKFSDIAVICRTNIGPRSLVQKLMEYNVPFRMKDSMPNIYEHWVTKNILSYIKIALGDRSRGEFMNIMNKPNRYISRTAIPDSEINFDELTKMYSDKEWMVDRICKLEYDIGMIKRMSPYAAINYICKSVGYDDYIKEYSEYRKINPQEFFNIIEELKESAKEIKTFTEWFSYIEEYTKELNRQFKEKDKSVDCIEVLTMHSSKGLEYEVVILPDANDGITPHSKAVLDEDIEEERRLFYVACTRAKEYLHICSVSELYGKNSETSMFVHELCGKE